MVFRTIFSYFLLVRLFCYFILPYALIHPLSSNPLHFSCVCVSQSIIRVNVDSLYLTSALVKAHSINSQTQERFTIISNRLTLFSDNFLPLESVGLHFFRFHSDSVFSLSFDPTLQQHVYNSLPM